MFQETKAENELALAYSGMGRLQKLKGEYAEARRYLTDALEIFERLGALIELEKVRKELAELPWQGPFAEGAYPHRLWWVLCPKGWMCLLLCCELAYPVEMKAFRVFSLESVDLF